MVSAIRYLLKRKENAYPHNDIYINIHAAIHSDALNVKRIEVLIALCCMYPHSDQEELIMVLVTTNTAFGHLKKFIMNEE